MGRRKSLQYQMTETIANAHDRGRSVDKHAIKHDPHGNKYDFVYSFKERESLCKFAKNFAKFMKSNYPNIKYVKDVTVEHINSYIETKRESCNNNSLATYLSNARKTFHLCNKRYGCNIDISDARVPLSSKSSLKGELQEIYRTKMMSEEHYNKLQAYLDQRDSLAKYACRLSRLFGLRNAESVSLTKESIIRDKDGEVKALGVTGKGGRYRQIPCDSEVQKQFLVKLVQELGNDRDEKSKLIPLKPDSVSARIRAALKSIQYIDRNGDVKTLSEFYIKTSQHSIRKLYSTETFKFLRDAQYERELVKGFDEKTAMARAEKHAYSETIGTRLGHSRVGRHDLREIYISKFI